MKRNILIKISIIILGTLFLGGKSVEAEDIQNHWGKEYIEYISSEKKILNGYTDGTFKPDKFTTRGEIVKIIANYDEKIFKNSVMGKVNIPKDIGESYNWITKSDWERVISNLYITGYTDGTFKPENNITRGEFANIIVNMMKYEKNIPEKTMEFKFSDVDNHWSKKNIEELSSKGIISGYSNGRFYPDNFITRAEVSKILSIFNGYGKKSQIVNNNYLEVSGEKIYIGDGEEKIISKFGKPNRIDDTPDGYSNYVYNNYNDFKIIGISKGIVKSIYSMGKEFSTGDLNRYEDIRKKPQYTELVEGVYNKRENNTITYSFVEKNNGYKVYSILIQDVDIVSKKSKLFLEEEEKILVDLVNSYRANNDMGILKEHNLGRITAKKHSEDMAYNDYFNHINLENLDPMGRYLKNGGTNRVGVGEVIGAGYFDSFYSFNGYVNSPRHRDIILNEKITHLGAGMGYNENSKYIYYNTIVVLINPKNIN